MVDFKTIRFSVVIGCSLFSCNTPQKQHSQSSNPLSRVQLEMSKLEVIETAGEPTNREDYGSMVNADTVTDEATGIKTIRIDTTHYEKWSYGENMEILFTNELVSGVDTNIMMTQQRLQHKMDSARQVEELIRQKINRSE